MRATLLYYRGVHSFGNSEIVGRIGDEFVMRFLDNAIFNEKPYRSGHKSAADKPYIIP